MKRLLTTLLAASLMVISPVHAATKNTVDETKLKTLRGLDIVQGELTKVTLDTYVDALEGFVFNRDDKDILSTEKFARSIGVTAEGEEYNGKAAITLNDALKYSVLALGYRAVGIKDNEYIKVAASEDLTSGISTIGTSKLNASDMVKLLYNLLDAEPISVTVSSEEGVSYKIETGETMLSVNRSIKKIKGVFEANEDTSIYSVDGAGNDCIIISDVKYKQTRDIDNSLLGYTVDAYIVDLLEPEVVYVSERETQNNDLTVADTDIISVSSDYSEFNYYDNNKSKIAKLSSSPKVIYNGKFYGDYTQDDICVADGDVKLVDNNNDKVYDVIFVTAYQTMIVNGINSTEKLVTSKLNYDGALDYIDLTPTGTTCTYTVYQAGEVVSFDNIELNQVLSVAMSKDGELCKIYISTECIQTEAYSFDLDEEEITIDDEVYPIGDSFFKYLDYKGLSVNSLKSCNFYFDAFGKLAYYENIIQNGYVLVKRVYKDEDTDDGYFVRYMDIEGTWHTSEFNDKVTLTNKSIADDKIVSTDKHIDKKDLSKYFKSTEVFVAKIKLNTAGKVTMLDTPIETNNYSDEAFTKTPTISSYIYRPTVKSFANYYYLNNNATLFVLPTDSGAAESDYYTVDAASYFTEDAYSVIIYDIDKFGYSSVLSTYDNDASKRVSCSLFVITGVSKALNLDGDVCNKITGCGSGFRNIGFITKDETVGAKLKKGDVINFMLNKKGYVNDIIGPLFNVDEGFELKTNCSTHDYYSNTYIFATIEDIDFENNRIKLNYESDVISFPLTTSIKCLSYNRKRDNCDLITTSDLMVGDLVAIRAQEYQIKEIVRCKEGD